GNDHVGQDETATILVDAEVQAAAADKPKGKRKKRRATGGASGSNLPLKRMREDYGTSSSVSASIGGKSLAVIQDSSHHSSTNAKNVEVASFIRSSVPPSSVMTVAVTTTVTTGASSTLVLGAGAELATQVYQSLFADSAYIGNGLRDSPSAACLGADVRMRSEHNIRDRKRFERKCARQADLLKEKDEQNIALEKERDTLEGQVTTLESVTVTKDTELASLNAQTAKLTQDLSSLQLSCDELSIKAASLESQRDGLID
ncbi:hypothetical protein Tco_1537087, partial [Tanacetum coccineum]